MEFRILGPLEVLDEGRPVRIAGTKQRALLAVLLLHANEAVSSDRLIDELWGEDLPAAGATALRVRVSQLRKALGRKDVLLTRAPGYLLRVEPRALDLHRFEQLVQHASGAEPNVAAAKLREALALWRGEPLADLAYEPFTQATIGRLAELRLVALERRIEADLDLGRHGELVAELRELVRVHPLRERLCGQLMLALYRSGRQAEAIEAYRDAREALVEELGLEPSRSLRELELGILRQSPALDLAPRVVPERSILVWARSPDCLDDLLAIAEQLSRLPERELILARTVEREQLARTADDLSLRRTALDDRGVPARVAAFASRVPGADVARLASEQDVDLLLLDGEPDSEVETVLGAAPCDVAVLVEHREVSVGAGRPVVVPFAGADHDWSALEIAAWLARVTGAELRLVGSTHGAGADTSRVLASASLLVQRVVGIDTSPLLVERGEAGLVRAAEAAGLIVFGLPYGWHKTGFGEVRIAVARASAAPTLLVRKGVRPGGLAPQASVTRFSWSLGR